MRTIWSTIWLRKASMSAQIANETNLYREESWAVRTRNGSSSGWCGSVFSKLPAQLSCCVSFGFTDFRSTSDNFMPLVSVLRQIFQAIRSDTERFHGDLQCIFEALFLASLGALALRQFAIEQLLQEVVIFHVDNMTGPMKLWLHQDGVDAWEEKPKLKLWCWGCVLPCDAENLPQTGWWKWFSFFICCW